MSWGIWQGRAVPITPADPFHWKQYPVEMILVCVRWYLRFRLSFAHLAGLAGRGLWFVP